MADDSVSTTSGKPGADEKLLPDLGGLELSDAPENQKISDPDDREKEEVPCGCGDEAHINLEKWYKGYLASSAEERVLLEDKFDRATLDQQIYDLLPQIPVTNNYCPSCQRLLDKWPEIIIKVPQYVPDEFGVPYQQLHFKNTLELEAGYRNGCRLCTLFVQCTFKRGYSLEGWHRKEKRLNCLGKPTEILVSIQSDNGYYNLTLTWPGLTNYCWLPADPLYCVKNYDQQLFTLGKDATHLTADCDLSQLELASKWLNACSETHESCQPTQDRQLPTRLIDVGSTPIRLVQTSSLSTNNPRYATLSHCWGTRDFFTLQEDNFEELMTTIPEEKLTRTFLDAVHITRSLGLQYLWIDSLCIIQRSQIDWRSESALMSSIYGGSTITIATAGATDGTKGCFLKPPGFVGKLHLSPSPNESWDIAPSEFYTSVAKSHLGGRAWALQERLLSPRILHFSRTELFWECRHCDASESFPEGSPSFERQHVLHRDRKPLSGIWDTIVSLYTGGKLTFASDKMVAISGIAQKVSEESGDVYLAGMWRKDIELQILWCQVSPGRRLKRGSEYRAPSWSWASVDEKGYVYYSPKSEEVDYVYYAHVIDAKVVPAGKEPFGELVGGELKMTCSVILTGKLRHVKGEEWDGIDFSYKEVDIEGLEGKKESFRIYPDSDELDGEDVYILPILETLGKGKYNKRNIKGLLLSSTGNKKGQYTRTGFFDLSAFDERYSEIQERFLKLLDASGKAMAEAQCAEVLSDPESLDERYVITIV
ncbi:heterokaryon incompatibility protein-domain-containing protein [Halenospora varia]|nr:heterokaryon incompatibility protein-domain-containing protein [Halenospora varia]